MQSLDLVLQLIPAMLLGLLLIVCGAVIGSVLGKSPNTMLVRLVSWWIRHVILPRLRSGGVMARSLTIFLNNSVVLAVVVATGADFRWGVAVVLGLGIGLGVGTRVLATDDSLHQRIADTPAEGRRVLFVVGVALNLLEPPAIVLAASLAVATPWVDVSIMTLWQTYLLAAVPLLILAAYGEAMWLGAVLDGKEFNPSKQRSNPDNSVDSSDEFT